MSASDANIITGIRCTRSPSSAGTRRRSKLLTHKALWVKRFDLLLVPSKQGAERQPDDVCVCVCHTHVCVSVQAPLGESCTQPGVRTHRQGMPCWACCNSNTRRVGSICPHSILREVGTKEVGRKEVWSEEVGSEHLGSQELGSQELGIEEMGSERLLAAGSLGWYKMACVPAITNASTCVLTTSSVVFVPGIRSLQAPQMGTLRFSTVPVPLKGCTNSSSVFWKSDLVGKSPECHLADDALYRELISNRLRAIPAHVSLVHRAVIAAV